MCLILLHAPVPTLLGIANLPKPWQNAAFPADCPSPLHSYACLAPARRPLCSVVTGPEIDAMSDEELAGIVNNCNIYARASPENKLRIVKALQEGPGPLGPLDGDESDDDGAPEEFQRNSQMLQVRRQHACMQLVGWAYIGRGSEAVGVSILPLPRMWCT